MTSFFDWRETETIEGGSVNVKLFEILQPFTSVTETEQFPAARPDTFCDVAPVDQVYVYPGVPPDGVRLIELLLPPLQEILKPLKSLVLALALSCEGCEMIIDADAEQDLLSVIVTE